MKKIEENKVIILIESQFIRNRRYFVNNHGAGFGKSGVPDFFTLDKNSIFCGIEAKRPSETPTPNQFRHGIKILLSGGRFIVAQHDFDLSKLDKKEFPLIKIGSEIGESEFEASLLKINKTTEFILK